jgi:hypothetical protein
MPAFKGTRKNSVVFVLGDLNAIGLGYSTHLAARDQSAFSRVQIWNSGQFEDLEAGVNTQAAADRFGPEVGIARTWLQNTDNDDEKLYILKYGISNRYMDTGWAVPGTAQTAVNSMIDGALATLDLNNENNEFYLCWVHGEYDAASASNAANYETEFPNMIAWLETKIKQPLKHVVIWKTADAVSRTDNDTVRQAQANIAASSQTYSLIETDDCGFEVGVLAYWDAPGQFMAGQRTAINMFGLDPTFKYDKFIYPIGLNTEYIDLPQSISDALSNASSFEINYSLATYLQSTYYVIQIADTSNDGIHCWLSLGNIKVDINGASSDITDTGGYDDNQPHRIHITWDGATLSQSIDGNTPLTASDSGPIDIAGTGRLFKSSLGGGNNLQAYVGDIQIIVDGVLIARYETADGIDSSGNENHGTVVNGPIRETKISELYKGSDVDTGRSLQEIKYSSLEQQPRFGDFALSLSISNSNEVVKSSLLSIRDLFFANLQDFLAIDRKNGQNTLSNDISNIDFTTGEYDNKQVTFTQDANMVLSTSKEGIYHLIVKSDDGSTYNLDWSSNVLGGVPSEITDPNGLVVKLYYDGTNFHA